MVLDAFENAKTKNFENILKENEPEIIEFRDLMYKRAKEASIDKTSDDYKRLACIGKVVEFIFANVEPPNDYTAKTDRRHFKEVASNAASFCKHRNLELPITLVISAWFHDIERFIPCTKCKYLPESVDKYRKQAIHAMTSAQIACVLLKGAPLTLVEEKRVFEIILRHDLPHPEVDLVILGRVLIGKAGEELRWELEVLMDADAIAFFETTLPLFIEFKAKKNTPEWIWERVWSNLKRLRVGLREKAVKHIYALPPDLLDKMKPVAMGEKEMVAALKSLSK